MIAPLGAGGMGEVYRARGEFAFLVDRSRIAAKAEGGPWCSGP